MRENSFTYRIVNIWNDLPQHVIKAKTVQTFESRLDRYWNSQEIKYDYKAKYRFNGTGSADISDEENDLVSEAFI